MSAPAIFTHDLTKSFGRDVVAVSGLDLEVERGTVFGLIGRNGAGKTTTLRLLMGLLREDRGEARVLGARLWDAPAGLRQRVAYVSQSKQAPEWMSVDDLCRYTSHFYDRWDGALARQLIRRWELPNTTPVGRLSGGMQRLASLVVALSARPEVLLLDEPASGLDPIARRSLLTCLIEALMRGDGCTMLLSTHMLGDLERFANRIGIMDRGRLVASGDLEDWQRTVRRVQVVFAESAPPSDFNIPGAMRTDRLGPVVTAIARVADVGQLAHIREIPGTRVQVFPLTLEEIFVELFREKELEEELESTLEDNSGQPGYRAGREHDNRVGSRSLSAVAPAEREGDE
jgi:ABC-2 type transport system ATP-binding protein